MSEQPLLDVQDLTMVYKTRKGMVSAIDSVSFTLRHGESMGLVGESGCGKTSIAMTLLRLMADNAIIQKGKILLDGQDLVKMSEQQIRDVRWRKISMVFQAAMNALNPVTRVGDQILEAIYHHEPNITNSDARERVVELFKLVGIDAKMIDRYPHEFSGGMRQRAIIAMALACNPALIIADEPTTALDVIVQDQVLRELRRIQKELNMSMIYISHDIAVIAEVAEKIGVMYAGRMVELADSREIFKRPRHPYTSALMSAFPSIIGPKVKLEALGGEPPDLLFPPSGCRFHPRCPFASERCVNEQPPFIPVSHTPTSGEGVQHMVACWYPVAVEGEVLSVGSAAPLAGMEVN
ncbi:MAG TPA: ABC transporter ATP-binding protein [Anaerolineaceae bacterium]|nr:ABC transporter ATP-binding protein [Anaerolineaceae bacterium]